MMKQVVHAQLNLVGDGSATSFTFDIDKVYGLHFLGTAGLLVSSSPQPFTVINPSAVPDSVTADFSSPSEGTVTAAISRRTIAFTFSAAPSGEFTLTFDLFFNG